MNPPMAKDWNLPVWNKPSSACLASRLIYGLEVTPERLNQVAKAEDILHKFYKVKFAYAITVI
mgnify:CR=1 FL=1